VPPGRPGLGLANRASACHIDRIGMRARVIFGVLSVLLLSAGAASASPDPYRDQAETIACPSAPPGWFNPPESEGGRSILTPLTVISQPDDPTFLFGAPIVQLDCQYRTKDGKDLQVSVRYALPIDINPWNDFYIGCTVTGRPEPVSTAAHAWNDHDRVYRVVGAKTWSLATFVDDLKALQAADVPRFEAMTDAMLKAAQPFAHNCGLAGNGKPVSLESIWTFNFDVQTTSAGVTSSANSSGSFVTTASTGTAVGAISKLVAKDFRLKVASKGKTEWLAIHVGAPIEFEHGYGSRLRTHVIVIASNDRACRKGSTGTLLVSLQSLTPPRVIVQVCGQTFLDGKGRVSAQIQTV
jgi:hypothetical protein